MSSNNINDAGAKALAEMLKGNTTLESLELNSNGIEYDGAVAIAEAIVENTSLKVLALRYARTVLPKFHLLSCGLNTEYFTSLFTLGSHRSLLCSV